VARGQSKQFLTSHWPLIDGHFVETSHTPGARMPWWFKSFLVILVGLLLLLLGDVASRASGGFRDATALRLTGAALVGIGVFVGLGAARGESAAPTTKKRSRG
jgi:hypothetical protein